MNASSRTKIHRVIVLAISVAVIGIMAESKPVHAGLLGGALKGAIIGGIIGGGDGAEAGAIIGGIGGAVNASARRKDQRRRQDVYYRQEMERRRKLDEQRLEVQRERNRILAAQQSQPSTQNYGNYRKRLVRNTQSALTLLGFDVGNADGQMNERTESAIRSYQQSYGLLATGAPSKELIKHMKRELSRD